MTGPRPPSFWVVLLRWLPLILLFTLFSASLLARALARSPALRPAHMVERAGVQVFEALPILSEREAPSGFFGGLRAYPERIAEWRGSVLESAGPCDGRGFASEFQERQCARFWERNLRVGLFLLLPLLVGCGVLAIGWLSVHALYRRLQSIERAFRGGRRERLQGMKRLPYPRQGATGGGLYGFLFRLRRARILGPTLPGGKAASLDAFFAADRELPLPGHPVALFPLGGARRYYGIPDTPQMAILSSRSDS